MAIVFALRGNNVLPAYAAQNTGVDLFRANAGDTLPASVADASTGLIGSSVLDVSQGASGYRGLRYVAKENFTGTNQYSILIRVIPRYTGSPAANKGIMSVHGMYNQGWVVLAHNSTGTKYWRHLSRTNTNLVNHNTTATWSPTADTCYDLLYKWDGTTDANKVNHIIDAVTFENRTASGALDEAAQYFSEFFIGAAPPLSYESGYDVEELVIWDEVIDETSVTLESGTGSLNGASRTSFVALPTTASSSGGKNRINLGHFG